MASNGQRGGTADLLWLNMLEHGCSWFKNHIYYHFVQIWVKYYIKCQQLFQSEFPLKCVSGCKYAYDVCWRGLLVTCLTDLGSPFLTGFNLEVKGFFLFYYKQMCVNSFEGAPDSMNTVIQLWYWLWEFQHQGQWQNSMCVCVCVRFCGYAHTVTLICTCETVSGVGAVGAGNPCDWGGPEMKVEIVMTPESWRQTTKNGRDSWAAIASNPPPPPLPVCAFMRQTLCRFTPPRTVVPILLQHPFCIQMLNN